MFEPGSMIIAREVWHDLLWAARPAIVVADDDGAELVHWSPSGTIGCFATSRFFPGRNQLPREERQLVSLETKQCTTEACQREGPISRSSGMTHGRASR